MAERYYSLVNKLISRKNTIGLRQCALLSKSIDKPLILKWFVYFAIMIAIGMGRPLPVHAGFFSDILWFFTGPDTTALSTEDASTAATVSLPLLGSQSIRHSEADEEDVAFEEPTLAVTQNNALIGARNPLGTLPSENKDHISVYVVKSGETPGGIAARHGITLNTLLWANGIKNPNSIKIGDELVILPVSGVQYIVKKGDTIEGIAKKFKADASDILNFNGLAISDPIEIGATIIIPDGELDIPAPASKSGGTSARFASLPSYVGYYIRPIQGGRRSRGIHGYNGIDLANACGLPAYASAEGTVILVRTSGWNGGYGKYLVITHPNGTQTLYAHMSDIFVAVGARVARGQQIANIGSTGNSTGCHVHFEIRGARNPF